MHSSRPTDNLDNDLTILCQNEKDLCLAFSIIMGKMCPEFICGFNDGDFDWQFIVEKGYSYGILESYNRNMSILYKETELTEEDKQKLIKSLKRPFRVEDKTKLINSKLMGTAHRQVKTQDKVRGMLFKRETKKLDANTNIDTYSFKTFGYITIDVRSIYRSIMNNPEQSSLNYFLTENKLSQKEDMPIVELFEIYNRMQNAIDDGNEEQIKIEAQNMARVKSYCVTDAEACHLLMHKRNVIMDCRNISTIAYTSMYDAIYRANGMKVCNYVMSYATQRDTVYSNISKIRSQMRNIRVICCTT